MPHVWIYESGRERGILLVAHEVSFVKAAKPKRTQWQFSAASRIQKTKKSTRKGCSLLFCGERGIRTPGASQHGGFQDRCNRPLYHLSERHLTASGLKSECKGNNKS